MVVFVLNIYIKFAFFFFFFLSIKFACCNKDMAYFVHFGGCVILT
jgi:hypothetical protein